MGLLQLGEPVAGVTGAAQPVDDDPRHLGSTALTIGDPADVAEDLLDAVEAPRRRLGDDQHPVRREEGVDGQQAERRRAVDDDVVVAISQTVEGDPQSVLGADRVGRELVLALGQPRRARHQVRSVAHRRLPPRAAHRGRGCPGPVLGEDLVDGGRGIEHPEPGGGVGLRIHVDHQGPTPAHHRRGGEAEGDGRLADAPLLIDHGEDPHGATVLRRPLSPGHPQRRSWRRPGRRALPGRGGTSPGRSRRRGGHGHSARRRGAPPPRT